LDYQNISFPLQSIATPKCYCIFRNYFEYFILLWWTGHFRPSF